MTAHVFIVDDKTFPVHLQYCFAGTGKGDYNRVDFNGSKNTKMHFATENSLVGMMADIGRIRKNDRILFYLQNSKGNEGRFYGFFRAKEESAFLDNSGENQFMLNRLEKSLTFRILFEPEDVYSEGATEWKALDEIRGLQKPHHMLWSLIYRKLKGNRGCTMITPYEEHRLRSLIRGSQNPLDCGGYCMDFDAAERKIVLRETPAEHYLGSKTEFSLKPRIMEKSRRGNQFEAHLQAYIVGRVGRNDDELTGILLRGNRPIWLGNEIGCGVGMQSIDVMVSYKNGSRYTVMPIELKTTQAAPENVRQIKRYVDWIEQYYIPNNPAVIEPVLIARKTIGSISPDFLRAVKEFNRTAKNRACSNLRLVEFEIKSSDIFWKEREIN